MRITFSQAEKIHDININKINHIRDYHQSIKENHNKKYGNNEKYFDDFGEERYSNNNHLVRYDNDFEESSSGKLQKIRGAYGCIEFEEIDDY